MKKILAIILSCMLILPCFLMGAFAAEILDVVVDGTKLEFDAPPFIDENNRTQVPVRALCVALGIPDENISFDTGLVSITGMAKGEPCTILLTIGSNIAKVNDAYEALDTSAQIIGDRTFVPLRFVTETFDCKVLFYEASPSYPNHGSLVDIKSPNYTKFTIYTTQTAVDNNAEKLLDIAATITGVHEIGCVIGENDIPTEKLDLLKLDGDFDILMDTGYVTDETVKALSDKKELAVLDEALKLYVPKIAEEISKNAELKAKVCDADGNIIAFPVERGGKLERFFVKADVNVNKAVSLLHGYREVILSMESAK